MEWNGMKVLGLSASLLAGRTAGGDNQLLPGPGQRHQLQKPRPQGQGNFLLGATSPLLAASAMPALGAMPGAYLWT